MDKLTRNNRVSVGQFGWILLLYMAGSGLVSLPNDGNWLMVGAAGAIIVLEALCISAFLQKASNDGEQCDISRFLSKPVGAVLGVLFIVRFIITTGAEMLIFGEMTREFILPASNKFVVGGALLLCALYVALKPLESGARLGEILRWVLIIPIISVVLSLFDGFRFNDAVSPQFNLTEIQKYFAPYAGVEIIVFAAPFLARNKDGQIKMKNISWFVILSVIVYMAVGFTMLGVFGKNGIGRLGFPAAELVVSVHSTSVFANGGSVAFIFWILSGFAVLAVGIFVASHLAAVASGSRARQPWVYVIVVLSLFCSIIVGDVQSAQNVKKATGIVSLILYFVIVPVIMFVVFCAERLVKSFEKRKI